MNSNIQIFIYFFVVLISYYFFYYFTKGEIVPLYKEEKRFDIEDAFKLWENLTSEQRMIATDTYYNSFNYYITLIKDIKNKKTNSNIDISIKIKLQDFKNSNFYFSNI